MGLYKNSREKQWRKIKGYSGRYEVSEDGEVKSLPKRKGFLLKKETLLKHKTTRFGYKTVRLSKNNLTKDPFVHRLVAAAFLTTYKRGLQINHRDGDKNNNHFSNLQWCTAKENRIHARDTGLWKAAYGEKHSQAKLKEKDVKYILASKKTRTELAKQFDVTTSTILYIKNKKTWKYLHK